MARLCDAVPPADRTLDGSDISPLLLGTPPSPGPRPLFHYFGVQLQAVREGPWKLFVPVREYPTVRVPSLWFEHQAGLFERQHRLWPEPVLYNLTRDPGEQTDLAQAHPEVVAQLFEKARRFDRELRQDVTPVLRLPGPRPPAAGQIRQLGDDLGAWTELTR
jgi:hypothetical protein